MKKEFFFVQVPRIVLADQRVKPTELKLYIYILDRSSGPKGAIPSQVSMSRHLGITTKQIRTLLRGLRDHGLIKMVKRTHHSNTGRPLRGLSYSYVPLPILDKYGPKLARKSWKDLEREPVLGGVSPEGEGKSSSGFKEEKNFPGEEKPISDLEEVLTSGLESSRTSHEEYPREEESIGGKSNRETHSLPGGVRSHCGKTEIQELRIEIVGAIHSQLLKHSGRSYDLSISKRDKAFWSEFLNRAENRSVSPENDSFGKLLGFTADKYSTDCLEKALTIVAYAISNWDWICREKPAIAGHPGAQVFASTWFEYLAEVGLRGKSYGFSDPLENIFTLSENGPIVALAKKYVERCPNQCSLTYLPKYLGESGL